jgi:DNA mismatch repair protein MutS
LAAGKSTFMVEMSETANILHNANEKSLIIIDEIGRGTSTYDGLSLAYAIARYLIEKSKSYTLFATHYFELTTLSEHYQSVKNAHLNAVEHHDQIIFMHKVEAGPAAKSYGIQVAALAGIPKTVLGMAKKYLQQLESTKSHTELLDLFNFEEFNNDPPMPLNLNEINILKQLKELNPDELTARQALDLIYTINHQINS